MNWLDNLNADNIQSQPIPIDDLLKNSAYYPSCGFDGGLVKDCNLYQSNLGINSFIYCDYSVGKHAFINQLNTFYGYRVLGSRDVFLHELTPRGWKPQIPSGLTKEIYEMYKDSFRPFAYWAVYEKDIDRGEDFGPTRFSLLYLGGEGVATYQALYWSNNSCPTVIAIIQPGDGFGLNYTKFKHLEGPFYWVINNNPTLRKPKVIYYGGYGERYNDLDWPGYQKKRTIYQYYKIERYGEVTIWENIDVDI